MTEHYFSASPSADDRRREITVRLAGTPHSLVTSGGVFSPEHLDQGTQVLLNTLESIVPPAAESPEPSGPILDLGCGWGPIALTAALRDPSAEVWAVDINERARELCTENAARVGAERVHVAAPEAVPEGLEFAAIHSNPPIRIGKSALHELLETWLPRLRPGGTASLVVAKHLGADSLQRWITERFPSLSVSRVARDKGFHVIAARRDESGR